MLCLSSLSNIDVAFAFILAQLRDIAHVRQGDVAVRGACGVSRSARAAGSLFLFHWHSVPTVCQPHRSFAYVLRATKKPKKKKQKTNIKKKSKNKCTTFTTVTELVFIHSGCNQSGPRGRARAGQQMGGAPRRRAKETDPHTDNNGKCTY